MGRRHGDHLYSQVLRHLRPKPLVPLVGLTRVQCMFPGGCRLGAPYCVAKACSKSHYSETELKLGLVLRTVHQPSPPSGGFTLSHPELLQHPCPTFPTELASQHHTSSPRANTPLTGGPFPAPSHHGKWLPAGMWQAGALKPTFTCQPPQAPRPCWIPGCSLYTS